MPLYGQQYPKARVFTIPSVTAAFDLATIPILPALSQDPRQAPSTSTLSNAGHKAVRRPPVGGIHVWLADVVALGDKKAAPLGRVVLRILQQSLMHIPDLRDAEDSASGPKLLYRLALNRLAKDYHLYEDMKELQGSVLPYCLGLHKMRNEEAVYVFMLEYVEGETLDNWFEERSKDPMPPVDQAWFDQLSEDEEDRYNDFCDAEQQRLGTHCNTFYEPPNAKWVKYVDDAKQLIPILFDAIATLNKRCRLLLILDPKDSIITKEDDKPKSVVLTEFTVFDDSSEENQWPLFLSGVVKCCKTHEPHLLAWSEQERSGFREALTWGDKSEVASTSP